MVGNSQNTAQTMLLTLSSLFKVDEIRAWCIRQDMKETLMMWHNHNSSWHRHNAFVFLNNYFVLSFPLSLTPQLLHLSKHWFSSHIWSLEILCNSFAINQPNPLFCFLGFLIPHLCPALRSAPRQGVRRPGFSPQ